jgi:hypothetical protein
MLPVLAGSVQRVSPALDCIPTSLPGRFRTAVQQEQPIRGPSSRGILRDRNYDLARSADIIGCGDA